MPEKAFTCIIDMDPQGNTSKQVLHKDEQALDRTSTYSTALNLMTRYMQGEDIGINDILPILKRTKMANTFLIPSDYLFDTESIS
jgi:cellulose biosynthesis protein BcsQ